MASFIRQEDVLGTTLRYLATGEGGTPAAFENIVPPGMGVPPHTHTHEDEVFYGLDGEITLGLEGAAEPVKLGPGGYVFGPRGRWHGFQNLSGATARMLVMVLPGANLLAMFAELSRLSMPPDPAAVGAITARYGVILRG